MQRFATVLAVAVALLPQMSASGLLARRQDPVAQQLIAASDAHAEAAAAIKEAAIALKDTALSLKTTVAQVAQASEEEDKLKKAVKKHIDQSNEELEKLEKSLGPAKMLREMVEANGPPATPAPKAPVAAAAASPPVVVMPDASAESDGEAALAAMTPEDRKAAMAAREEALAAMSPEDRAAALAAIEEEKGAFVAAEFKKTYGMPAWSKLTLKFNDKFGTSLELDEFRATYDQQPQKALEKESMMVAVQSNGSALPSASEELAVDIPIAPAGGSVQGEEEDIPTKLIQLKKLLDLGVINESDFEQKKRDLLSQY